MPSASTIDEVFLFSSQGLPETTFHVARFTGSEGLNELFLFRILLVCNDTAVDRRRLLHTPARFIIRRENGEDAVFTGYPTRVEQGGFFNGYAYYTVELRPTLWKLTRIVKSAIFLEQDVQSVVDDLLNSEKFLSIPHEFRFTGSDYPRPEFAMQYEETLYDYMQWRLEEQGAYFYFSPDGDAVIFADSPNSHDTSVGTVFYSPATGLEEGHISEVVTSFTLSQDQLPARVIVRGYDWKDPNRIFAAMAPVSPDGLGDVVLTNEAVASEADARRLAAIRAEAMLAHDCTFTGTGSVPYLRPGVVFTLARHYSGPFNRDYMVTKITHEGSQETMLGMLLGIPVQNAPDHLSYRNTFTCIASDTIFRPARTAPRAKIAGVVHAFIDGENDGARPFLDEYGRYKLLFPFDVSDRSGGKGSCWIRRAQEQVGKDCGTSFPLLPGTEVLVGFIDGNPDRPVITGALANGETGALTGSGNTNISGIRTPGGNQITINDTDTHQGMAFLTASGSGITMSSDSLDWSKSTTDLGLDAASIGSSGMAAVFKNQLSGSFSSSGVATVKGMRGLWLVLESVLQGAPEVMDSLSANAASDTDLSEGLAWGNMAAKLSLPAYALFRAGINAWGGKTPTTQPFGYEVKSSKNAVVAVQQCNQSLGEIMALVAGLSVTRLGSIGTGAASLVRDITNDTLTTKEEEAKFKNDLKNKGITDPTEQDKKWNIHKENKKMAAIRKAVVSQGSDLLPALTALITTWAWTRGLGKKTLGGIKLNAEEQNIHLQAATYTGVHALQGILLNTEHVKLKVRSTDVDEDPHTLGRWGAPVGAYPAHGIGASIESIIATQANTLLEAEEVVNDHTAPGSFIALNTDLTYQQSKKHIVWAAEKAVFVAPKITFRDNDGPFESATSPSSAEVIFNNLGDCKVQATKEFSVNVATGHSTTNFTKILQSGDSISLTTKVDSNETSLSISNGIAGLDVKKDRTTKSIGLDEGGAHINITDTSWATFQPTGIVLEAPEVKVGGVIASGGNLKGTDRGVLEIGGAIKVIGCNAQLDLKSGFDAFQTSLNEIKREIDINANN